VRSTTHWNSLHLLEYFGAIPVDERVVLDGRHVSAAGVSSGIDGALRVVQLLCGDRVAQTIQLMMQYAPEPPFAGGTPATSPPEVVAWWVQNNIKVTPRLTVNVGLRHDIWSPYREVLDRESFFNPDAPNAAAGGHAGILQFYGNGADSCHCSSQVATDYRNFGPRVGVAYGIGDKLVIRAGYTIMYTHRGAVGGRGGRRTGTERRRDAKKRRRTRTGLCGSLRRLRR